MVRIHLGDREGEVAASQRNQPTSHLPNSVLSETLPSLLTYSKQRQHDSYHMSISLALYGHGWHYHGYWISMLNFKIVQVSRRTNRHRMGNKQKTEISGEMADTR